jgi:hypothetical protein
MKKFLAGTGTGAVVAAADNDITIQADNLARFDSFMLYGGSAGACDVDFSVDSGLTYISIAALEDTGVAAPATRVLVTAATKLYLIAPGLKMTNIRVRQNGATAIAGAFLIAFNRYSRLN